MVRMDYYVLTNPDLCFKDILQRHLCNEQLLAKKTAKEYEKARSKLKENSKEKAEKSDESKNEKTEKSRRASVSILTHI